MRRVSFPLVGMAVISVSLLAQTPANPSFEVASVKPNKSDAMIVQLGAAQPGGRFVVTNAPLLGIIRNAYQLQLFQILNVPDWVRTERFDIEAKAASEPPPVSPVAGPVPSQMLMLRSLLAERFKLRTHTETRELPIYHLVMAKPVESPA